MASGKESACQWSGRRHQPHGSLSWEDPLEEEMATQSSTLVRIIPRTEEPWWATVHGVTKSWTDWARTASGEGVRFCVIFPCVQILFWLVGGEVIGWCSRNLVLSLKLSSSILHLGGLSSFRTTQRCRICVYIYINLYIPWGGTRVLLYCCKKLVSWLLLLYFCILSLFWLATVWIWLGPQVRSRRLNEAHFLQTRNERHGKDL